MPVPGGTEAEIREGLWLPAKELIALDVCADIRSLRFP